MNLNKYHRLFFWLSFLGCVPIIVLGTLNLIIPQVIMLVVQLVAFVLFLTTKSQNDET